MAEQAWEVWIDFPSKPITAEAQQSHGKGWRTAGTTYGESQRWAHPDGEGGRAWTLVDMQTAVGEVPGGGVGS